RRRGGGEVEAADDGEAPLRHLDRDALFRSVALRRPERVVAGADVDVGAHLDIGAWRRRRQREDERSVLGARADSGREKRARECDGKKFHERSCAISRAIVSAIIEPTANHETTLYQREFVCSPISSRSLINSSTKIRTNGSRMPLTTCDSTMTRNNGKCGVSTTPAPKTMSAVYSQ